MCQYVQCLAEASNGLVRPNSCYPMRVAGSLVPVYGVGRQLRSRRRRCWCGGAPFRRLRGSSAASRWEVNAHFLMRRAAAYPKSPTTRKAVSCRSRPPGRKHGRQPLSGWRVRTLVHDAQSEALKFTVDGPVLAASSARVVAPKHTRSDTGSTLTVVNIPVDPGHDPAGRRTDRDDGLIQHVTPPTQDAVTATRDTVHDGSARRHARRDGRGRRPRRPASVHVWSPLARGEVCP